MKVIWSPEAERALNDILDYIARDSPEAAKRFIARIKACADHLARFPKSGRRVPERRDEDLRELIEGNYRVIYSLLNPKIVQAAIP